MRPLLVGEANPYGGPPGNALIPDPPYCAGWNLCHRVMQLSELEYYERFDRVNLCDGKWSIKEAKTKAIEILATQRTTTVLFGAKVCNAFAVLFEPFRAFRSRLYSPSGETTLLDERTMVILPHLSGLSRAWNEPGAFERARAVLREAGVL